jgi:hypothetical protein
MEEHGGRSMPLTEDPPVVIAANPHLAETPVEGLSLCPVASRSVEMRRHAVQNTLRQ